MNANLPLTERRPAMTLLSGPLDIFSHCCRIVLLEKDVDCAVEFVSSTDDPAKIGEHNPYSETPTLIDRDVSLYNMWVIIEYLDERFPHPPLMPVDPITRAKTRLIVSRLTRDWLQPIYELGETLVPKPPAALKKSLHDGLVALSPIVADQPFFLGGDFTLVDAYMAPLLWRLPLLGVELPKQAAPLLDYGESLFKRTAFHESLSDPERDLR
jgi:RNA polymerase-associated protein